MYSSVAFVGVLAMNGLKHALEYLLRFAPVGPPPPPAGRPPAHAPHGQGGRGAPGLSGRGLRGQTERGPWRGSNLEHGQQRYEP